MTLTVRCSFYARTATGDGRFRYEAVDGHEPLPTPYPPQVGDIVERGGDMYQVIARQWMYPARGSMDWPASQQQPTTGPLLTLIVELANGVFRDEAPQVDETEGQR